MTELDELANLRGYRRRLWRQRGFSAGVVGTLALGIAATTTLFALVQATLLAPLPYHRADDIYFLKTAFSDGRFTIGRVSTAEFLALRELAPSIESAAWAYPLDDILISDAGSRRVQIQGVSEEFFDLFGMGMAYGRPIGATDVDGQPANAVISHWLWSSAFGNDPDVIDQTIQLAGRRVIVRGIAPPGFDVPHDTDLWVPIRLARSIGHQLFAWIRMPPGQAPETIAAPMQSVFTSLEEEFPDQVRNRVFEIQSLLYTVVGDLGPTLVIALGASGLLLLLALVNVTSLLIARSAARAREMAVRTALGATRWRLVRQAAGEASLLAAAAAVLGAALGWAAIRVIIAVGGSTLPRVDGMRLDVTVLLFVVVASVLAAVVVALVPALSMSAARHRLTLLMNDGARTGHTGRTSRRWLQVMVLGEVALAVALVAGAGRVLLSLSHLTQIDPGFSSEGRLVVDAQLPLGLYRDPTRQTVWQDAVDTALLGLGADRVAASSALPMHREWDATAFVDIVGRPTEPAQRPNGRLRRISPTFFDALDIPVRAGRPFAAADRFGAAPVCIVNEQWARTYLADADPLGTRVMPGAFFERTPSGSVQVPCEVVGVAADVRYGDITSDIEPIVYVPLEQTVNNFHRSLIVTRADGRPEQLQNSIREALSGIDPLVAVDIWPMASVVSPALTWSRLGLMLMGAFGTAAVALAVVGTFGVVTYVVTQRTGEMAIRLALGATRGHVFGQVVAQAARVIGAGAVVGSLIAWWSGRLMAGSLHGVEAGGWLVVVAGALLVLAAALVAVMVPARAATTVTPARLLRG